MKGKKLTEHSDDQIIKGIEKLCQESAPEPGYNTTSQEYTPKEIRLIKKVKAINESGEIPPPFQ